MTKDRFITGAGTSEERWLEDARLQVLPAATMDELVPSGARLVVCAPHPDDEILPCGGLVAAAHAAGRPVVVLAITDGEMSHGGASKEDLRRRRPRETDEALRALGVDAEVVRLRLGDGNFSTEQAAEEFESHFREGDAIVVPWRWDGHPDHEAAAEAALAVAERKGGCVLETMIWGWHWADPAEPWIPWENGVRFELPAGLLDRKRRAIREFHSQIRGSDDAPPILAATTLQRFDREWEVFWI